MISHEEIRSLLEERGWVHVPNPSFENMWIMEHPDYAQRQLCIPTDPTLVDYDFTMKQIVRKLFEIEGIDLLDFACNVLFSIHD